MASIMIPARGCVYMPNKSRGGDGFYKLDPPLKGQDNAPILIEGVDLSLSDIVYPVATLDENKYVFVMGEDFGNVTISGVALLGKASLGGASFGRVMEYFKTNRVSKSKTLLTASLPGSTSIKFYLTGIAVSKPDAQFHMQFFVFRGIAAEPKSA